MTVIGAGSYSIKSVSYNNDVTVIKDNQDTDTNVSSSGINSKLDNAEAAVSHPAFLPMASIIHTWIGRDFTSSPTSWVEAAINLAALPYPGEWSVIAISLSIVFGIPTTLIS